ncbi:MAG TPA: glycosyltransferase family 4 protein, partial [Prosthecobacter sp.]|nr:glycosyltransferase family 4 protein [Prosthecobacter sp.]
PVSASPVVRIGIVGQVEEWKGHHNLLAAFARVAGQGPRAEIHVYGSGSASYMELLKRQAEELGLGDWVVWHGFVQDRRQIYQELDFCVVPVPAGANEALPTVAIEAGFFGLPVIASRRGGLVEILEDGVTGFLVEAGDLDQLAERLQQLIRDSGLRERLGQAARLRVEAHFSRKRFVVDFLKWMEHPPEPVERV